MENLRSIRKLRNLTQEQLGEISGVDQATISKLESGKSNFTMDMARKLASGLKIEPVELFSLPELQMRAIRALREITDPERQRAAVLVLETMAGQTGR